MATPIRDKRANRRVRLIGVLVVVAIAGMFARAFWLQMVDAPSLSARAQNEHQGPTEVIQAIRGTIFDSTGIPLAIGEQRSTVTADPAEVVNPRAVAEAAHQIFGVNAQALYVELTDKASQFAYVDEFATAAKAAQMLARGFVGVYSYPVQQRMYPEGSVAAPVIGYAGVEDTGLSGLEYEYNSALSGRNGSQSVIQDPSGQTLEILHSRAPVEGRDVFTTIDHQIQAQAQQVLRSAVHRWGAKSGTAIVLDPRTGAVLAMAQTPIYNNNRTPETPVADQTNSAVTDTYEPGSIFKVVTFTAALTEGIVTPNTRFTLPYQLRYGPCEQCTVHDADFRPTETLSAAQILAQSSNVGTVTIAKLLGAQALQSWIKKFGFGEQTGIDFPGESPGYVLPLPDWSETTIGNVPIGQGILVTPIQMASVYAAIANGGVWIQPHLVSHIQGSPAPKWVHRRIMSPQIDAVIRKLLTGVVSDAGATGTEATIPGYTVAGKTGTAQEVVDGKYSNTVFTASFIGMVPASDPQLVVLVKIDDPTVSIYGGTVAAPAFAAIAKFDLQYLEVPPNVPSDAADPGSTATS